MPERVAWGLLLIVAGGVAIAGSNVYVPWLFIPATLAHLAGWAILPGDGWRRIVAAIVSTAAVWLVLAGPHFAGVLVLGYLAWMLARHRPPLAWLSALLPVAAAVVIGLTLPGQGALMPELAIMGAAMVAAAWIAAAIARPRSTA
jgi:hypothetical protein